MKTILYIFLFISFACTSCNKYLDVQPIDRLLDQQVFSSESSVQEALNGIYINLAKPTLYGASLTSTHIDVMAQYYNLTETTNQFYLLSKYNYGDASVQSIFDTVWRNAYTAILNINQFINNISNVDSSVVPAFEKNIFLGEAYGLRAFISFDMLRIFGPVYRIDSTKKSIPYPTAPQTQASPLLAANVAIDSILNDLELASNYLKNDPVIQNGVLPLSTTENNFLRVRNNRMNYYAVKALMARINLYRGNKTIALNMAKDVIAAASKWFPFSLPDLSLQGISNPDRTFSSEVLFGLINPERESVYNNYFAGSNLLINSLLAPQPDLLSDVFANTNDYRFRVNWAIDRTTSNLFNTFYKYAPITNQTLAWYNLQPLLRISELYFIAAECEPDKSTAINYLNTVRFNRGLPNLNANADVDAEIKKEYQREFWGEGQLFFYYKRLNFSTIDDGTNYGATIAMGSGQYIMPLPLSETLYR